MDISGAAGSSRKNTGAPSIIYNDVDSYNLEVGRGLGAKLDLTVYQYLYLVHRTPLPSGSLKPPLVSKFYPNMKV